MHMGGQLGAPSEGGSHKRAPQDHNELRLLLLLLLLLLRLLHQGEHKLLRCPQERHMTRSSCAG